MKTVTRKIIGMVEAVHSMRTITKNESSMSWSPWPFFFFPLNLFIKYVGIDIEVLPILHYYVDEHFRVGGLGKLTRG